VLGTTFVDVAEDQESTKIERIITIQFNNVWF